MPTPIPVSGILADSGTLFSGLFTIVGSVVSTVVSQPLLLISVLMGFLAIGVGIFHRLRG